VEPRVSIESISVEADDSDARAAVARIGYKLVASQASEQISVRVQLGG